MVKRVMVKLQSFSITLLLAANMVTAEENKKLQPLDEDFLEFIANMSEVDGEVVDTLDMLEIADNDMKSNNPLNSELISKNKSDESKELKKIDSLDMENKP